MTILLVLVGLTGCRQEQTSTPDAGTIDAGGGDAGTAVDAGPPPSNEAAGLQPLFRFVVPDSPFFGTPHLTRAISLHDGTFAVANSLSVIVYRRTGTGLEMVANVDPDGIRCTTFAYHAPSHSLLCGSADARDIFSIDTSTWKLRQPPQQSWIGRNGYRQIAVQGSSLYLAGFKAGLLRATITNDGNVGTPVPYVPGEFVAVDSDDTNVVALDREQGLVVFHPNDGSTPVFTLPLSGPPVGLRVHDKRAIVAMGSQGAIIVDLEKQAIVAEVRPKCVVFSADARDTRLAVGCSTAILDYDLSTDPPRLFGYDTAEYGITDVLYRGDELLSVDWRNLVGYHEKPSGDVLQVDILPGLPLAPEVPAKPVVRNFGDKPLHVILGPEVPAGGDAVWEGPPEPSFPGDVKIISTEEDPVLGRYFAVIRSSTGLRLGDAFSLDVPSSYVTFISPDCALQWYVLEDLAWFEKNGGLPDGMKPLVITVPSNDGDLFQRNDFPKQWGLEMKTAAVLLPGRREHADVQ